MKGLLRMGAFGLGVWRKFDEHDFICSAFQKARGMAACHM
jgi:hypothetical protein